MSKYAHSLTITEQVRTHIERARKRRKQSQESIAYDIALAAEQMQVSRFYFTGDIYHDANNARVRVYRWLNGEVNMPADILPAILSVLDTGEAACLMDSILAPVGLATRTILPMQAGSIGFLFGLCLKEVGEAHNAVFALLDGIDEGELETARKELNEAIDALTAQRNQVDGLIAQGIPRAEGTQP
jgi:hypothetical protein